MAKRKKVPETRQLTLDKNTWGLLEVIAEEDMRPLENFIEWLAEQERRRRYDTPPNTACTGLAPTAAQDGKGSTGASQ